MTAAMNVMTVIKAKSALIKYNSWMLEFIKNRKNKRTEMDVK